MTYLSKILEIFQNKRKKGKLAFVSGILACSVLIYAGSKLLRRKNKEEYVFGGKIKKEFDFFEIQSHKYKEALEYEKNWRPKEGDIICTTFPKTGQTMLLQLMNQLRSNGEDKTSMFRTSPFIQRAWEFFIDLDADQLYKPRVFKTHQSLGCFSEEYKAKYITIVREPEATMYSKYQFFKTLGVLDEFPGYFFKQIDWFIWYYKSNLLTLLKFYTDYYKVIDRDDFLILCYEDVLKDKEKFIKIVAKFMEIPLTQELLQKVVHKTDRKYMLENAHLMGGKKEYELARRAGTMNIVPDICLTVTTGEHQKTIKASPKTLNMMDQMWQDTVFKEHGLKNYQEYRQAIREHHTKDSKYQVE